MSPREDRLDRPERAAGDRRRRVVHARERRVVARPDPRLRRGPRIVVELREALDGRDVAARVAQKQVVVRRRLGCQAGLGAELAEQVDRRARSGAASAGATARSRRSSDRGPKTRRGGVAMAGRYRDCAIREWAQCRERVPSAHGRHAGGPSRGSRGGPRLARTEDAAEARPGAGPERQGRAPRVQSDPEKPETPDKP